MPPKKGGKKGNKKNFDDDEHWEQLKAKSTPPSASTPNVEQSEAEEEAYVPRKPTTFLPYDDIEIQEGDNDEGDDLMAMIAKSKSKKDKKKKNKIEEDLDEPAPKEAKQAGDEWMEEPVKKGKKGKKGKKLAEESDEDAPAPFESKAPVEAGDDWMEEEFGPTKKGKKGKKGRKVAEESEEEAPVESKAPVEAGDDWMEEEFGSTKKGKKGKNAKGTQDTAEVVEETAENETTTSPKPSTPAPDAEEDEGVTKVLSKKEKEKLKKEKEKAKKKAQAAAKKAAGDDQPAPEPAKPEPAPQASIPAEQENNDEAEEDGAGESSNKKKKKKKKAADKATPAPAAPPKKGGAQIAALRALVEAQKAKAEEEERRIKEEQERIDAEERRLAEEEKKKEEEKQRRKEKEKAKTERLRKEGKLLTAKQKADKAAAEVRRKALLETSGFTVAALKGTGDGESSKPKRPVYGKKRKGPQQAKALEPASGPVKVEETKAESDEDIKDAWDASSEDEEKKAKKSESDEDVKDEWDAPSSDEEAKPAPKAASKPVSTNSTPPVSGTTSPTVSKSAPKPPVKAPAKPAKKEESESEEESDEGSDESESDSDSEDDSDSDSDSDDDSSDSEKMTATQKQLAERKAAAKERRLAKEEAARNARSKDNMRSPICVILGHVDTGKTSLLDKIRQTNVQEGEAGGITQQIGATFFPMEAIKAKTAILAERDLKEYKLPGLLVIDTPGHESFTNLRSRGSSLCNIAILVVDIMHGLEPQTLESMRLLRAGKTPFIVALNKVDRLYDWKSVPNNGFQDSLSKQSETVKKRFRTKLDETIVAFAEQGFNAAAYYENKDLSRVVSLVPTSAFSGEGVPDMLMLIIKLTQERMAERLMYLSTLECTVLEVKVIEGLGTTIDVVLSNGILKEGDTIVVCGLNGPIVTQVRALLTPQPMKEMRVKGAYVHHKEVKASLGVKIVATDLEKAIAGSRLLVLTEDDDEDELRDEVMSDLSNLMTNVDKSGKGVSVQASTLGALEALLEFLRTSNIPVAKINIGPVHRKDVMQTATMLEKAPELAIILCFDVPVDRDAESLAESLNIKVFKADIIYHLFDAFVKYKKEMEELRKADSAPKAVFPVRLKTLACFAKRDPIILGCDVLEGTAVRVGTPLCVVKVDPETKQKTIISLGKITSLEINHKSKDVVKKSEVGAGVAIKIEHAAYEAAKQYGRHFDENDEVISMISRESIEVMKKNFRDEMTKDDWILVKALKIRLDIP